MKISKTERLQILSQINKIEHDHCQGCKEKQWMRDHHDEKVMLEGCLMFCNMGRELQELGYRLDGSPPAKEKKQKPGPKYKKERKVYTIREKLEIKRKYLEYMKTPKARQVAFADEVGMQVGTLRKWARTWMKD